MPGRGENYREEMNDTEITTTMPEEDGGVSLVTEKVPKDYIEKIDFHELIFFIVNWPNSELYGAFVSIMHHLDQSATS